MIRPRQDLRAENRELHAALATARGRSAPTTAGAERNARLYRLIRSGRIALTESSCDGVTWAEVQELVWGNR